jgi:hypothetical protein
MAPSVADFPGKKKDTFPAFYQVKEASDRDFYPLQDAKSLNKGIGLQERACHARLGLVRGLSF